MIKIRMRFSGVSNILKKVLPFGNPEEENENIGTEQLEGMKKRIEFAKGILSDPKKTHYNIVMIPEAMSIYESERSLETLAQYKIPVESVIVNQLIPENSKCGFCREKRKTQQERMSEIRKRFDRFRILELQLFKHEVKGLKSLEHVANELYH